MGGGVVIFILYLSFAILRNKQRQLTAVGMNMTLTPVATRRRPSRPQRCPWPCGAGAALSPSTAIGCQPRRFSLYIVLEQIGAGWGVANSGTAVA
jgi:hypothetical protein